jgi:uncharacterized protein (TIGR04255 family)
MHFKQSDRVEYKNNLLFEVVFQARFPEILKISREDPAVFQEIIRKDGYPELGSNISDLPHDIPDDLKRLISGSKEFFFLSEEKDWQVSLTKNFIALTCIGNYSNYTDFKDRLKKVLTIFNDVYEPSYFSRIGLRYRNIVNDTMLSLKDNSVRNYIPEYIFPELKDDINVDVKALQKTVQLDDEDIKVNVVHALVMASGKFGREQINSKESYIIDIDCFCESKIKGVENVLAKCDEFKRNEWNIFQWSITEDLREAMGPIE